MAMLMRVRVSLPDRPGALGQVARSLGTLGADIHQVTVLEREAGRAVDDFTVSWPGTPGVDEVRDRLSAVPGVHVEGAWPTRDVPGSAPDYDLLRHVAADPGRAFATLVDAVPDLVGADWAAVVATGPQGEGAAGEAGPGDGGARTPPIVHRSWRTPPELVFAEPVPQRPQVFGDGEARFMAVPLDGTGLCLVTGRLDGLPFHRAELAKLARVTELVAMLARSGAEAVPG
ncbi:amino acid-binding protein [Microtetraspora sp. NBRC 13810]|uniref:amino acid-binding protein n=1 Tax=Microtetraspora sp. NBRC 13810 TaxID=3030990 RepID=UPI0024A19037|nr:amino acid-binding protein [Microtetraspora sp. NBRC 13810]GLW06617.1 amino acid-binding protein [Microtetraspora sp. NBRC 13810]